GRLLAGELSTRQTVWAWVFLLVMLLFHLFGVFILFFVLLFHAMDLKDRYPFKTLAAQHWKFFAALFAVALGPWAWFARATGIHQFEPFDPFMFIHNPLKNPLGFFRDMAGNLIGRKVWYPLLAAAGVSLFVQHPQRRSQALFFICLIILPLAVHLGIAVAKS